MNPEHKLTALIALAFVASSLVLIVLERGSEIRALYFLYAQDEKLGSRRYLEFALALGRHVATRILSILWPSSQVDLAFLLEPSILNLRRAHRLLLILSASLGLLAVGDYMRAAQNAEESDIEDQEKANKKAVERILALSKSSAKLDALRKEFTQWRRKIGDGLARFDQRSRPECIDDRSRALGEEYWDIALREFNETKSDPENAWTNFETTQRHAFVKHELLRRTWASFFFSARGKYSDDQLQAFRNAHRQVFESSSGLRFCADPR